MSKCSICNKQFDDTNPIAAARVCLTCSKADAARFVAGGTARIAAALAATKDLPVVKLQSLLNRLLDDSRRTCAVSNIDEVGTLISDLDGIWADLVVAYNANYNWLRDKLNALVSAERSNDETTEAILNKLLHGTDAEFDCLVRQLKRQQPELWATLQRRCALCYDVLTKPTMTEQLSAADGAKLGSAIRKSAKAESDSAMAFWRTLLERLGPEGRRKFAPIGNAVAYNTDTTAEDNEFLKEIKAMFAKHDGTVGAGTRPSMDEQSRHSQLTAALHDIYDKYGKTPGFCVGRVYNGKLCIEVDGNKNSKLAAEIIAHLANHHSQVACVVGDTRDYQKASDASALTSEQHLSPSVRRLALCHKLKQRHAGPDTGFRDALLDEAGRVIIGYDIARRAHIDSTVAIADYLRAHYRDVAWEIRDYSAAAACGYIVVDNSEGLRPALLTIRDQFIKHPSLVSASRSGDADNALNVVVTSKKLANRIHDLLQRQFGKVPHHIAVAGCTGHKGLHHKGGR